MPVSVGIAGAGGRFHESFLPFFKAHPRVAGRACADVLQAPRALRAGKYVSSTAPTGVSEEGSAQLSRTVNELGRTGILGETSDYRPSAASCRARDARGAFGQLVHAEAAYFHDRGPSCGRASSVSTRRSMSGRRRATAFPASSRAGPPNRAASSSRSPTSAPVPLAPEVGHRRK